MKEKGEQLVANLWHVATMAVIGGATIVILGFQAYSYIKKRVHSR